ncbi:MAG: hypothetical protein JW791_04860 [Nanoarchaeota archaeon]|nr:hypothetical protein [Nanoarchaeota archaeon]
MNSLSFALLNECFRRLKGSLALNTVRFDEGSETADINCKNWSISVGPGFVYELLGKGLSEEEVYEGLLVHEIGHFRHHPFNLETHLLEIDALMRNNCPLGFKGLYDDFMCNSRIILEKKEARLSKIYSVLEASGVLGTLNGFYNYLSRDYGGDRIFSDKKLTPVQAEKIERLKEINIKCARSLHPLYLIDFYNIFKDDDVKDESLNDLLDDLGEQYGEDKVVETVKRLIDEGKINGKEAGKYCKALNIHEFGNFEKHVEESRKYSISVQKLRRTGLKFSSPFCPVKAGVEDLSNYDPFNSFASGGKAVPGLSYYWISKEDGFLEEFSTLNDLVLMVDSSGSMTNPNSGVSSAVVSAMTVAGYYIANDRSVAVVNFSNNTFVSGFSKNKDEVFREIFKYQGGGTTLNVDSINLDFKDRDVLIITDEEISNFDETISFLSSKKSDENHVYIISIQGSNSEDATSGIRRIKLQDPKDIPKIVIGE